MEKKLNRAINELVSTIKQSVEYQDLERIKAKMDENTEIKTLVSKVKELQKKLIKTGDSSIEVELEKVVERLNSIPLYDSYNKRLEIVNRKIEFIKDELNDYFVKVVNIE